jgi:predicted lipoprotein with Yx(FWY)xxD motif
VIHNRRSSHAFALLGALALSACTSMGGGGGMGEAMPAKRAADGTLTNAAGMTLYTFDKDSAGRSACNGGCAANWPPLTAGSDAKAMAEWSTVTREDGSKQWAYNGKPLYTWKKDEKPGDKTGDGFLNNTWHVAKG